MTGLPLVNNLFIYLGFYVTFNTVQVISQWVVGRAEETSTHSSGFCTVNCRPTTSNYQLSHLRPSREPNPGLRGGRPPACEQRILHLLVFVYCQPCCRIVLYMGHGHKSVKIRLLLYVVTVITSHCFKLVMQTTNSNEKCFLISAIKAL